MVDDTAAARESGFGTGLLAHLERGRAPEPVAGPASSLARAGRSETRTDRERDERAELERLLAEREAALAAAQVELARREAREAALEPPAVVLGLPEHLRARAEGAADRVWAAFGDALEATHPDGRPDHAMRIAAAQALLAELRLDPPGAAFADELARRRELREASR